MNAKLKKIISAGIAVLSIVLSVIYILVGADLHFYEQPIYSGGIIQGLIGYNDQILFEDIIGIVVFLIILGASLICYVLSFFLKKKRFIVNGLAFVLSLAAYITTIVVKSTFRLNFILLLASVCGLALLVFDILAGFLREKTDEIPVPTNVKPLVAGEMPVLPNVIISVVSLAALIVGFFIPVYYYNGQNPGSLISALTNSTEIFISIGFIVYFICIMLCVVNASNGLLKCRNDQQAFYSSTRTSLYRNFVLSIAFYVFCIVAMFTAGNTDKTETTGGQFSLGFVPFLLCGLCIVIQSVVTAKYFNVLTDKKENTDKFSRILTLIFALIFIAISVACLLSTIITVDIKVGSYAGSSVTVNGLDVLNNYGKMDAGYQSMAFIIYAALIAEIVLAIVTVSCFINKSKFYNRSAILTIGVSFMLTFALALFGKYYEIAQKMTESSITQMLYDRGFNIDVSTEYVVHSNAIYFFIGAAVLLFGLAMLKPFSKQNKAETIDVNILNEVDLKEKDNLPKGPVANPSEEKIEEVKTVNFDACPAFTEIDLKEESFKSEEKKKNGFRFKDPTLPEFCKFIVLYAKNSRLHLSYSVEDIAQFVAGLGATKLSILQGMSGTGKTSLPKIFSEAIFGKCNIVEVESSWKDKNELIGFYNEFSQRFTPKKFTQALYEAKFTENDVIFIVLDEMNLSRVEYYFSDFLSLMENEEDQRRIKLVNTKLLNTVDGKTVHYKKLNEDHTLYIPKNVWFIGTANRDESTFEISDKVYDRANTINFNKRAPKVRDYSEPVEKRYVTYGDFSDMLENAKKTYSFDAEKNSAIARAEALLEPYNISFGNRILKQIEDFVSVYCSCFDEPEKHEAEAVERILLSKVVAKLEFKSVENKAELAGEFKKANLLLCAQFVSKLNEDI